MSVIRGLNKNERIFSRTELLVYFFVFTRLLVTAFCYVSFQLELESISINIVNNKINV